MLLTKQVHDDMQSAMKSGDSFSLGVLRMLAAALQNKGIEKRGKGLGADLTDDEARAIFSKEMKKRQDAVALYEQGGRADLAEQEKKEAAFIARYLPLEMSFEETEKSIARIIAQSKSVTFNEAMKAVMAELKGKADGKTISDIIKKRYTT